MRTPPFLRWTLALSCPLRLSDDWQDPEQAERHLRALHCYSDAVAEKRVFNGVAVQTVVKGDPVSGFLVDEVLQAYGGRDEIAACLKCPANVASGRKETAYAGCFGLLTRDELDSEGTELAAAIRRLDSAEFRAAFPLTSPAWYGIARRATLSRQQVQLLYELLTELIRGQGHDNLRAFHAALGVAWRENVDLNIKPEPAGAIEGKRWVIDAHCAECFASWQPEWRKCEVCRKTINPFPGRARKVKGDRPYWELKRFLDADELAELLAAQRDNI